MNRVLAIAAICLVCGALAAGLFVLGGPQQARNEKYDQTRLADLQGITNALSCKKPTGVPAKLTRDEISSVCSEDYSIWSLTDPQTKAPYAFQVANDTEVEICATFYDVDQLKKSWSYKHDSLRPKFSGNVGCFTQTVVKADPA